MPNYPNLKILHVSSEKTWRGGEQQIAYLIGELSNQRIQNVVLCKRESAFESYCLQNNIEHYTASFRSNLDIRSSIKLKNICQIEVPDIIHTHSSRSHSIALYGKYFGNNIPLAVSRRVDFPIKTNWKYNDRAVKRIICVSNFIQKLVSPTIKTSEKCITIYDGIDINKFSGHTKKSLLNEYGFDQNYYAVGNTSAIADHKDYFTFVDAAEEVIKRKENVAFFIIGEGPLKELVQNYVLSKKLQNKIILTGFRSDIINILPGLDCFLMTSKTEGLGTSLLDALAAKVPVVATNGGGIPEIIINGKTGLLSDVGNSNHLAEHVLNILENHDLVNSLITGGLEHVKNFSKQIMANKTYQLYQSIMKEWDY